MKIRKGDTILVISGKDRGKRAKVFRVFPQKGKVLVEGVNLRKKHQRSRQQGKKGEVILRPAPVRVSNVMIICPKCSRPTRIGYVVEKETKLRICKKCKGVIE